MILLQAHRGWREGEISGNGERITARFFCFLGRKSDDVWGWGQERQRGRREALQRKLCGDEHGRKISSSEGRRHGQRRVCSGGVTGTGSSSTRGRWACLLGKTLFPLQTHLEFRDESLENLTKAMLLGREGRQPVVERLLKICHEPHLLSICDSAHGAMILP